MIREAHILAQQVLRAPEKILQHLRQYVTHPTFLPLPGPVLILNTNLTQRVSSYTHGRHVRNPISAR